MCKGRTIPGNRTVPSGNSGSNSLMQVNSTCRERERESRSTPIRGERLSSKYVRRCPTLPQGLPCSTIGAERLNFRVRDGTGCFPFAMAAETLWRCGRRSRGLGGCPYLGNRTVDASLASAGKEENLV